MELNPIDIIKRFYTEGSELYSLLLVHSSRVTELALSIGQRLPDGMVDLEFVRQAAMLHDIGVFLTDAPGIHCHGTEPYICHGVLGRKILDSLGLHRHALVCERHTGAGITVNDIKRQNLPLPQRDMLPITNEEKLICFADKFFSKTRPEQMKTLDGARRSLQKFGEETLERFEALNNMFNNERLIL